MRKVLLVHISSSGCCNTLATMLNNGDFGFPYCATPAFSTPTVWCRVFQSRVFHPCSLVPRFSVPRFPLPRFQSLKSPFLRRAPLKTRHSTNFAIFAAPYIKCVKGWCPRYSEFFRWSISWGLGTQHSWRSGPL